MDDESKRKRTNTYHFCSALLPTLRLALCRYCPPRR
uniref:Uncharacterized protein n=1 Tax=Anguilla anguilla TaxID=7936 RepID=A0A0E9QE21_ANGAN